MIFWFLYLLIFPFHLFAEGSVQIADLIFLIGVIFNIKKVIYAYFENTILKALFLFSTYTLIVGLFFSILYQDPIFLKSPANYIYCYIFVAFTSIQAKKNNFKKVTIIGIFISLIIQLITFLKFSSSEELRVLIYFNNPNQLGFWAINLLFVLIFYFITSNHKKKYNFIFLCSIFFSVLFVIMSISQAAIIAALLMIMVLIIKKGYLKLLFISSLILFIFLGTKALNSFNDIKIYENALNRIQGRLDGKDDNGGIEGRNYNRISYFPQYLVFGSGEGKNERFGTQDLNEIHSSYANVLFSYGLIGFILFFYSYFKIFINQNFTVSSLILLYLSFSILHNTIRWPLFWVIPILIYYNGLNKKEI